MEINQAADQLARRLAHRLKARHLALLASIYRHRSLRLVAAELNQSQPGVTKALQEIEALVGTLLFERTRRGLLPTPVADMVVARGQTILAEVERLAGDLIALDMGYRGVMRVGVIPLIPQSLLTAVIAKLRHDGNCYRFVVRDGSTDALVAALRRHELDCVLARFSHADVTGLEQTMVYIQRPCLIANRRHPLQKARELSLADLIGSDWILPASSTPTRRAFEEMLVRRHIELGPPIVETIAVAVIKQLLREERMCVALLPDDIALEYQHEGVGKILPVDLDFELPSASFIRRREPVPDRTVSLFEGALRQSLLERQSRKQRSQDEV